MLAPQNEASPGSSAPGVPGEAGAADANQPWLRASGVRLIQQSKCCTSHRLQLPDFTGKNAEAER